MKLDGSPGMMEQPAPLHLPARDFRPLLEMLGPSLALWRAAEIAALREQTYEHPILDLGCGDGIVISEVLPRIDIGLDPNREALAKASRRGIYRDTIPLAAERACVPEGSLATVVSNSVLEHLPQLDAVLEAVSRMLRPGGRLIFTAPTKAFAQWLVFPSARYSRWRNRELAHVNLWPLCVWQQHLERAGLAVIAVRPYLRRRWVMLWDYWELWQTFRIAGRRLFGLAWRRLPALWLNLLAQLGARLDLASPAPGGGRLVVAEKR